MLHEFYGMSQGDAGQIGRLVSTSDVLQKYLSSTTKMLEGVRETTIVPLVTLYKDRCASQIY